MPLLSIDIEARFAKFQDALNQIEKNTTKAAGNMGRSFEVLKGTLAGMAGALSVGALAGVVKQAIDAADHLNDLSKETGIAVDTLGGLGFAAGQAGGDLENVAAAAGKLNKAIAGAAAGNAEFSEAFAALGISVKDTSGNIKKADVVMAEIADKFAKFEDGPNKAALALALFGKAGAAIIPLLNDGGEALRANIEYYKKYAGVTQEVADRADAFNDTLGKLHLISGAFSRTLAAEMLPALQAISDEMLQAKEHSTLFETAAKGLGTIFDTVVVLGANVAYVFKGIASEISGMADQVNRLAHLDFKGFSAIGDKMKDDAKQARAEIDAFDYKIMHPAPPSNDVLDAIVTRVPKKTEAPGLNKKGKGGAGDHDNPARKELDGKLKDLERASEEERRILASRNEFLQTYYQRDLLAIGDYYDARRAAQAEALRAEQANLAKELAKLRDYKPKDKREKADIDNKVEALLDKRAALEKASGLEMIKLQLEQTQAAKEFENVLRGINAQLMEQQGLHPQAAAVQFDLAYEPLKTRLATERQSALDKGDSATVAARDGDLERVATLRRLAVARAELNGLDEVATRIQSDLTIATERAGLAAKSGASSELVALRAASDARAQAAVDLGQVAEAFEQVAAKSGDLRLIQQAKELQLEVAKLADSADLVRDKFQDAFTGGFESFIEKLMAGTATVKDAFKALVGDIAGQIQKMIARDIAGQLLGKDGPLGGLATAAGELFGGKRTVPAKAGTGVAGAIAATTNTAAKEAVEKAAQELASSAANAVPALTELASAAANAAQALQGGGALPGAGGAAQVPPAVSLGDFARMDRGQGSGGSSEESGTQEQEAAALKSAEAQIKAAEGALQLGSTTSGAAGDLLRLAQAAAGGNDALLRLPSIISLIQSVAAAMSASSAASGAGGLMGGLAGLFGGGGGTASAGAGVAEAFIFKNGGALNAGNVVPFARGGLPGVVNAPTFFPMAGGKTGLMGEAGPEAIMPLKRDQGGELAVTVVGERGNVSLLPVTRDRAGRMAVKANKQLAKVLPFARGAVFGGPLPPAKFASGAVFAGTSGGGAYPALRDPLAAPAAAPNDTGLVVHNNFTINGPASRETQAQIAAAAGLAVNRALWRTR